MLAATVGSDLWQHIVTKGKGCTPPAALRKLTDFVVSAKQVFKSMSNRFPNLL